MTSSSPPRIFEAKDVSLLHASTNTSVPLSSLYSTSPLVLIFLRRWGCQLCRGYAFQVQQQLLPHLTANSVTAVAVGFERQGIEEFSPFFPSSSLYIDTDRSAYEKLGLQRMGGFTGILNLMSSGVRAWNNEVKAMGITGNFKGDGMQMGGTYVIGPGGEVWMERKQTDFADHPSTEEVLAVLEQHMPGFTRVKLAGGQQVAEDEKKEAGESTAEETPSSPPKRKLERIGGGAPNCTTEC